MGACQVHLAYYTAGQVNRNKHFVKTLLHLEDIFFDGLTILVNELNKFFSRSKKRVSDCITRHKCSWIKSFLGKGSPECDW